MILSKKDSNLYFELFLLLINYTNKKCFVNPSIGEIKKEKMVSSQVLGIADVLWENVELIDEYIAEHPELPEHHREIIESWKRRVRGKFVVECHLKTGSIFISIENESSIYLVSGLTSELRDMPFLCNPPILVEGTLLPFRDVIIYDGMLVPYNLVFGQGMKNDFKEVYLEAKREKRIITSL